MWNQVVPIRVWSVLPGAVDGYFNLAPSGTWHSQLWEPWEMTSGLQWKCILNFGWTELGFERGWNPEKWHQGDEGTEASDMDEAEELRWVGLGKRWHLNESVCTNTWWEGGTKTLQAQTVLGGIQTKKRQQPQIKIQKIAHRNKRKLFLPRGWLPTVVVDCWSLERPKTLLGRVLTNLLEDLQRSLQCQWFHAPSLYWPLWHQILAGNLTTHLRNKGKAWNSFHLFRINICIYLGSAQNAGGRSHLYIFLFVLNHPKNSCEAPVICSDSIPSFRK